MLGITITPSMWTVKTEIVKQPFLIGFVRRGVVDDCLVCDNNKHIDKKLTGNIFHPLLLQLQVLVPVTEEHTKTLSWNNKGWEILHTVVIPRGNTETKTCFF